jgi:histidinol dehydrogenase
MVAMVAMVAMVERIVVATPSCFQTGCIFDVALNHDD